MKKLIVIFAVCVAAASSADAQVLNISRLDATIRAAGIPIDGVSGLVCGSPNTARIDFRPEATAQQRTDAQNILLSFDCGAAAQTAFEATQSRAAAVSDVDNSRSSDDKKLRAVLAVAIDEINALRQWIVAFKAEVAASTNLANLQSRVATLPNMPDRTQAQAITAIKNKINAGTVD